LHGDHTQTKVEAENATHFVVFAACRNRLRLTQPGSPGQSCRRRDPFGLSKRTTCSSHPRWQRVSLHRTWALALVALASFVGGTKSNSTRSRARSGRLPRRGADRGRERLAERERGAAVGDGGVWRRPRWCGTGTCELQRGRFVVYKM